MNKLTKIVTTTVLGAALTGICCEKDTEDYTLYKLETLPACEFKVNDRLVYSKPEACDEIYKQINNSITSNPETTFCELRENGKVVALYTGEDACEKLYALFEELKKKR